MSVPNYKGLKMFAHRIDEQLCDILDKQLTKVLEEFESGLSEKYRPEIQAIILFTYYMLSMFLDLPTPGMLAMDLSFLNANSDLKLINEKASSIISSPVEPKSRNIEVPTTINIPDNTENENKKYGNDTNNSNDNKHRVWKICMISGYIISLWMIQRLQRRALLEGWRNCPDGSRKKKLWKTLHIIDFIVKIADISNVCLFFFKGVFPSFLYRVVGSQMVQNSVNNLPISSNIGAKKESIPGYSSTQIYVKSRQLLWQILIGLLTTSSLITEWKDILVVFKDYFLQLSVTPIRITERLSVSFTNNLRATMVNMKRIFYRNNDPTTT
jgi:hypothetical protein